MLVIVVAFLLCLVNSQQAGTQKAENHPKLDITECTIDGGCNSVQKSVVIDANWRWLHNVGGYQNCYTGTDWDHGLCPDGKTCAKGCALDGADYQGTYGVTTSGNALKLGFVTHTPYGDNVGSRLYLMDSDSEYYMFKLKNKEFTFDVDVSHLPCGINGALYMIEMQKDGGMREYEGNNAGAKFGTGYCDAQCPHDIKFINGEANCEEWNSTSATGHYGTCCAEMDIWEANSMATAYTGHVCSVDGQYRCEGKECGDDGKGQRHDGVCDKDGCDLNPFRCGDKAFFGQGSNWTIDTTQKLTVITQWVTDDGTDDGDLKEIRRIWQQNGKTIQTRPVTIGGKQYDSVSDDFCDAQKKEFGDPNDFKKFGGNKKMGEAGEEGMVLALSLWDDHAAYMLWLDSNWPLSKPSSDPGVARGTCSISSGRPDDVEKRYPSAYVEYSNIRYGDIGSTIKL